MTHNISQEVKELVSQANSIYILITQHNTLDMAASALALQSILQNQGKTISVAAPKKVKNTNNVLDGVETISQEMGNRNLVITLKLNSTDDIDKVSYHVDENESTFNLVVQPKADVEPIKSDTVSYSYTGTQADLVMIIGANSLQDLGFFYEQERKMLTEATTLAITSAFTQPFATHMHAVETGRSFSETIVSLAEDLGYTIPEKAASNLLAGIDQATNNLQSALIQADTFQTVATLLKQGGKRKQPQANSMAEQPKLAQQSSNKPEQPKQQENEQKNQLKSEPKQQKKQDNKPKTEQKKDKDIPDDWLTPKVYKGGGGSRR